VEYEEGGGGEKSVIMTWWCTGVKVCVGDGISEKVKTWYNGRGKK
jgi:hypothetical protein